MNILIVGLGLIGGSYASGLSKKGHQVFGVDKSYETISYAKDSEFIVSGSNNPKDFIFQADVIILGLYPKDILIFLAEYSTCFTENQIITDVCGVKSSFVYEAIKLVGKATYLTHHPMAGREKSGILYANSEMFKGMNFLICPFEETKPEAISIIKQIGLDLGFTRISLMTPHYHDEMISFTSQLTHAIAVSLVNSDSSEDTKNYIGDSYRDLTRIAMINEKLWSELFLENREYLMQRIEDFEVQLDSLKTALNTNDKKSLEELFIKSTKKRKEMEK